MIGMKILDAIKTRWVLWVWHHTPSCAEMSRLASRSLDQPLSLRQRLQMRFHFLICAWCARYFQHLNFLHRAGPALTQHEEHPAGSTLPAEARQRILRRIRLVEVENKSL